MSRKSRASSVLFLALCALAACKDDPPRILSISPGTGPQGGGTTISVEGLNFDPKSQLFVGGAPCGNVSLVSSGSLTGTTPSTNILGAVDVTVKNDDGQRDKIRNGFTYTSGTSSVTVSSISPTSGSSGTSVTINGTGFQANATVTFGSASATGVTVASSTQITCTAPGGTGPTTVTVTNTDNSSGQLSNAFTYPGTGGTTTGKQMTTFAGNGTSGSGGDGAAATQAQLSGPQEVVLGQNGVVFIADTGNNRIRRVDSSGNITTVSGTETGLNGPRGLAIDSQGNLYIADTGNHCVKRLASGSSTLTIFAGTQGTAGSSGENVQAPTAQLNTPIGLAIDGSNNLFIADSGNHKVRVVSPGNVITTFAGTGNSGNGTATVATSCDLNTPSGVTIDASGNVYIADTANALVRRVQGGSTISTFAGGGTQSPGDNGPATSATLGRPVGLAVDAQGGIVIADEQAQVVRIVSAGTITRLAGNGTTGNGADTGTATELALTGPRGVAAGSGLYFVTDTGNNKVRRIQ